MRSTPENEVGIFTPKEGAVPDSKGRFKQNDLRLLLRGGINIPSYVPGSFDRDFKKQILDSLPTLTGIPLFIALSNSGEVGLMNRPLIIDDPANVVQKIGEQAVRMVRYGDDFEIVKNLFPEKTDVQIFP